MKRWLTLLLILLLAGGAALGEGLPLLPGLEWGMTPDEVREVADAQWIADSQDAAGLTRAITFSRDVTLNGAPAEAVGDAALVCTFMGDRLVHAGLANLRPDAVAALPDALAAAGCAPTEPDWPLAELLCHAVHCGVYYRQDRLTAWQAADGALVLLSDASFERTLDCFDPAAALAGGMGLPGPLEWGMPVEEALAALNDRGWQAGPELGGIVDVKFADKSRSLVSMPILNFKDDALALVQRPLQHDRFGLNVADVAGALRLAWGEPLPEDRERFRRDWSAIFGGLTLYDERLDEPDLSFAAWNLPDGSYATLLDLNGESPWLFLFDEAGLGE